MPRASALLALWAVAALFLTVIAFSYLRGTIPDPSINVRWSDGLAAAERAELERRFGLDDGQSLDGATWSYRLTDASRANVEALVRHGSVADTHKIDRVAFEVEDRVPFFDTLARAAMLGIGASVLLWLGIGLWRIVGRLSRRFTAALLSAVERFSVLDPQAASLDRAVGRWEPLILALVAARFLTPLLIYGPYDNEESGLGFFSSQVYYRDLFAGRWRFWLNDLGFGTPLPIGQRFDFHPVFALGSLVSLRAAVSATWIVHVALMLVYFSRLAALLGAGPLVRTAMTVCYLYSAPSVNYFYVTDWLSVVVGWSLYPALAYYLLRIAIDGGVPTVLSTTRLALLGAVWVLNSHPGYIASLAFVLAIFVVLVAPLRLRVYGCLVGAVCLCAAAVCERLYFSLSEGAQFPESLPRLTQGGTSLLAYALANAAPFVQLTDSMRQPFIGLVAGMAAVASVFYRSSRTGVRAASLAFAAAAVFSLLPETLFAPFKFLSAIWFFRDPLIFFGLLAGGVVLQRAFESPNAGWRAATVLLLLVQLLQQGAAVNPGLIQVAGHGGPLHFYRYQDEPVRLAATLVDRARVHGPRLYTSEPVRRALRGGMSANGIHSLTDLVLFGLDPVNGWFKNVSMDRIHPSAQLMHGVILGQREVIGHQPLLDVLGINLVWATTGDGPFPPALLLTDRWKGGSSQDYEAEKNDLVLFANPQAWPRAVLVPPEAALVRLPLRPGCPHQGAMCRDFTALARQRLPAKVALAESDGFYGARFPSASEERLLFVSAAWRREWEARSDAGPLQITPAAEAFLGVRIPPGVDHVEVRFEPRVRAMLTWVSAISVLALTTVVAVSLGRRRGAQPPH